MMLPEDEALMKLAEHSPRDGHYPITDFLKVVEAVPKLLRRLDNLHRRLGAIEFTSRAKDVVPMVLEALAADAQAAKETFKQ